MRKILLTLSPMISHKVCPNLSLMVSPDLMHQLAGLIEIYSFIIADQIQMVSFKPSYEKIH